MCLRVLALWLACLGAPAARGADWPMWRGDAARSGASSEALPAELHSRWVRKLAPPRAAWPNEPRLHFDASHEPVVLGKTLFLGSPNDATLAAYGTETGERLWSFLAGGPVRLAPVAWKGRVCFGSDDGFLYCLDAASGELRWKVRGAPDERPDRRHLGNTRLVSFWPVRGGPVLADGVLYFGAGVWPTLGVFLVAVEADSGRVLWRNDRANLIEKVRVDHNELSDTGLSPQGHLAIAGDVLLVPSGRSMPACLDRGTGKVLRYIQGYRNGDCRVAAMGTLAFAGRAAAVDITTGREVGSRWAQAGKDAPARFDPRKFELFEGPIFPYKKQPGLSAWSAFTPAVAYGAEQGTFYAYDLTRPAVTEYEAEYNAYKARPWRWDLPELWKLPTEHAKAKPASDALIQAGNRLYGHAGKTLLAVELPTEGGAPKVVWQHPLGGTPTSLAAADGKLFVATKEGDLCCFSGERTEPRTYPVENAPLPKRDDAWTRRAADILRATGAREGYALVLGLGTGRLLEELLAQSSLRVLGVDAGAAKVQALHARLVAAGLYGTRAELFVGAPFEFPFPPYLASLIVSEQGFPNRAAAEGLSGVLHPYGGVLCLDASRAKEATVIRRPGPLPGSAWWTHECADAARSFFSHDQLVKAPLGVLWYGQEGDNEFWSNNDYGIGVKPQVVGGRVFAFSLPMRALFAYDAYTGRHLWKAPQTEAFSRFASLPDGIHVAAGGACTVLDPATGAVWARFPYAAPDEANRKPIVSDIRVGEGVLLIAVAFEKVRVIEKGLWDSTLLVALDRQSGATLWSRKAKHRFNNNALALGRGTVFAVDSPSPIETAAAREAKDVAKMKPSDILALDARTGAVRWSTVVENPYRTYGIGGWTGLEAQDDWLAYCEPLGLLLTGKHGKARAYHAASGDLAWEQPLSGGQPLILRGDTFLHQNGIAHDTRTGKPLDSFVKAPLFRRDGGCNYAVANPHLVLFRNRTACYVDVQTRTAHYLRNIRSGCSNSLIASDGILSVPNYTVGCVCNYPIRGSFAMVHMPEAADWAGTTPVQLERGTPP